MKPAAFKYVLPRTLDDVLQRPPSGVHRMEVYRGRRYQQLRFEQEQTNGRSLRSAEHGDAVDDDTEAVLTATSNPTGPTLAPSR